MWHKAQQQLCSKWDPKRETERKKAKNSRGQNIYSCLISIRLLYGIHDMTWRKWVTNVHISIMIRGLCGCISRLNWLCFLSLFLSLPNRVSNRGMTSLGESTMSCRLAKVEASSAASGSNGGGKAHAIHSWLTAYLGNGQVMHYS